MGHKTWYVFDRCDIVDEKYLFDEVARLQKEEIRSSRQCVNPYFTDLWASTKRTMFDAAR